MRYQDQSRLCCCRLIWRCPVGEKCREYCGPGAALSQTPIHYVMTDAAQSDKAKMHAESLQKLIQSFGLSSEPVKIENGTADLAHIAKFLKDSLVRDCFALAKGADVGIVTKP